MVPAYATIPGTLPELMPSRLPPLRRQRRRLNLTTVAARFLKGVAQVEATVEPFARWWDEHNDQALHSDGPLWVALGDSVTQGIGASDPALSYAWRTLERLRLDTGQPWRLINLSMSGGRFEDVVSRQLGVVHDFDLEPAVVSAIIGSNDVIWRRNAAGIVDDARIMVDALPPDTILSRVSEAKGDQRRRGVNQVFDAAEATGAVHLFRAWDWPEGSGMWAQDKFHPSDKAYGHLHTNLYSAFQEFGVAAR